MKARNFLPAAPARPRLLVVIGLILATRLALIAQPVQVDPAFAPQLLNDTNAVNALAFTPLDEGQLLVRGNFTHLGGEPADGFARLLANGTRDSAFATTFSRQIVLVAPLSDGRFIALTAARDYSSTSRIERFLSNGTPDATYLPVEVANSYSARFLPQPDGRVLAVGYFSTIGSLQRNGLARLNQDGTLDSSFDAGPTLDTSQLVSGGLAVQPDGKVIYSVYSYILPIVGPGWANYSLRRLNADGSADNSFGIDTATSGSVSFVSSGNPYHAIAILPDGRILAATGGLLQRFSANGVIDNTYSTAIPGLRRVDQVVSLADGRVLVQVRVSPVVDKSGSSLTPSTVFLLDADGAVVRDFRTSLPADVSLELLASAPAGPIVVRYGFPIIKPQFPGPILMDVEPVTIPKTTSTNQSLVYFPPAISLVQPALARFDLAGVEDNAFAPVFTQRQPVTISRVVGDSAGRLIAAGSFTSINGQLRPGLARFLADGTLDSNFLPFPRPAQSTGIALVQPDGKIILSESVLGAKDADGVFPVVFTFERLQVDGSPDFGFQPAGLPNGATLRAIDGVGRLFASGFEPDADSEANLKLFMLNPDGSRATELSTTFGGFRLFYAYPMTAAAIPYPNYNGMPDQVSALLALPDGKLLVGASVAAINNAKISGFTRLNADGSTDVTHHPAVPPPDPYYSPQTQFLSGGRVLFTDQRAYGLPPAATIRLLADGSRDPSFTPLPGAVISNVIELSDGSLLSSFGTDRWLANGLPDLNYGVTFDANAYSTTATEASGLIYLGGNFVSVNGQPRSGLARLVSVSTPAFTQQPQSQSVVAGRTATFQAAFGAGGPVAYQWTFNGTPILGATSTALVLRNVHVAQSGIYRVVATTGAQSYTSDAATLTVIPNTSRLANFSARSRVAPGQPPQIGGCVLRGTTPRPVLLRGIGLGLANLVDPTQLLSQPVLRLYAGSASIAENTGGALASDIVAVASRVGAFSPWAYPIFPETNYGSALSLSLTPGAYTAQTTSGDDKAGISLFEFYDAADATLPPAVLNVSLRGHTAPGNDVMIAGFVIAGNGPLTLLIRGIGPELARYGVPGALDDPQLTLYSGSSVFATNDNWSDQPDAVLVAAAAQSAGAFVLPPDSRDAAILVTLEPGAYTVQGGSVTGTSGEILIELYVVE